jgi:hypothetical protein
MENDNSFVLEKVVPYLQQRGWHRKSAKSSGTSLLFHTIVELDVLTNMLPLLSSFDVSDRDLLILQLSVIAHDSGKEKDEWQEYLSESEKYRAKMRLKKPKYVSHVDTDLVREIVSDLQRILKLKFDAQEHILTIMRIIDSHMKRDRMDAALAFQKVIEQSEGKIPSKWLDLSLIVSFIDNLCSCEKVEDVPSILMQQKNREYEKFRQTLKIAYHQVNRIRGISTSLIHKAVQNTYGRKGWVPILHFPDGTAYIGSIDSRIPLRNSISEELNDIVVEFIEGFPDANVNVVVGTPTASSVSTEIVFHPSRIEDYLKEVIRKNKGKGAVSVSRAIEYLFNKELTEYLFSESSSDLSLLRPFNLKKKERMAFLNSLDHTLGLKLKAFSRLGIQSNLDPDDILSILKRSDKKRREFYSQQGLSGDTIEGNLEELRIWLGKSKSYNALFEFINSLINKPSLVSVEAREFLVEEISRKFCRDEKYAQKLRKVLPLTGPYNPLPYQILFVDHLPEIFGEEFEEATISWISKLLTTAWEIYGFEFRGVEDKTEILLSSDLVVPYSLDFIQRALNSKDYYELSKEQAFSERPDAQKMCPICNEYFDGENRSISEIVGFSKKFSNRLAGAKSLDNINICEACGLEYLLRSLVLTRRPNEMIIVYPQMNTTFKLGETLEKRFREIQHDVDEVCGTGATDLSKFILLRYLDKLAGKISEEGVNFLEALSTKEFIQYFVFSRDLKKPGMRSTRDLILQILETEYPWDTIGEFNSDWDDSYTSFEQLIDDIIRGENLEEKFLKELQEKTRNLRTTTKEMAPTYITPNFAVILLSETQSLKRDDISDTDAGFEKIFLSGILSFLFDSPVALVEADEEIPRIPGGLILIPPISNVKRMISKVRKRKGIPNTKKWLSRMEGKLWTDLLSFALVTKQKAQLSDRTGIFEVLSFPTVGHLMRRIEMKRKFFGSGDLRILKNLEKMEVL